MFTLLDQRLGYKMMKLVSVMLIVGMITSQLVTATEMSDDSKRARPWKEDVKRDPLVRETIDNYWVFLATGGRR